MIRGEQTVCASMIEPVTHMQEKRKRSLTENQQLKQPMTDANGYKKNDHFPESGASFGFTIISLETCDARTRIGRNQKFWRLGRVWLGVEVVKGLVW